MCTDVLLLLINSPLSLLYMFLFLAPFSFLLSLSHFQLSPLLPAFVCVCVCVLCLFASVDVWVFVEVRGARTLTFTLAGGANMSQSPALQESDVFNRAIPREGNSSCCRSRITLIAGAKKLVETQRHPGMQNQNIDGDEHPVTTDLVLEQGPGSEQYSHCFNSSASGKLCYASSASQRTPCFYFRNHNT